MLVWTLFWFCILHSSSRKIPILQNGIEILWDKSNYVLRHSLFWKQCSCLIIHSPPPFLPKEMHYRICPKGIFTQDPTTCKSEVIISVVHQDQFNQHTYFACSQAPRSRSRTWPSLSRRWWSATPPCSCCQAPRSWSRTCPRLTWRWWSAAPPLSCNQAPQRRPYWLNGVSGQKEIIESIWKENFTLSLIGLQFTN